MPQINGRFYRDPAVVALDWIVEVAALARAATAAVETLAVAAADFQRAAPVENFEDYMSRRNFAARGVALAA